MDVDFLFDSEQTGINLQTIISLFKVTADYIACFSYRLVQVTTYQNLLWKALEPWKDRSLEQTLNKVFENSFVYSKPRQSI